MNEPGSGGLDVGALRALVREVLREALADAAPATPASGNAVTWDPPSGHNSPRNGERAPARHNAVSSDLSGGHNSPRNGERAAAGPAPAQDGAGFTTRDVPRDVETVSLRTDAELGAFVTRLLHLFENPKHRADLRAGRLRFRLPPQRAAGAARPAHRIEKGAVTEAAVRAAAQAGARLVLGRRAVLTPLARDRARAAGVEIEKEH